MLYFKFMSALAAIGKAGRNAPGHELVEATGLHFEDAADAFRELLLTAPEPEVADAARRALAVADSMIDLWVDRQAERYFNAREYEGE